MITAVSLKGRKARIGKQIDQTQKMLGNLTANKETLDPVLFEKRNTELQEQNAALQKSAEEADRMIKATMTLLSQSADSQFERLQAIAKLTADNRALRVAGAVGYLPSAIKALSLAFEKVTWSLRLAYTDYQRGLLSEEKILPRSTDTQTPVVADFAVGMAGLLPKALILTLCLAVLAVGYKVSSRGDKYIVTDWSAYLYADAQLVNPMTGVSIPMGEEVSVQEWLATQGQTAVEINYRNPVNGAEVTGFVKRNALTKPKNEKGLVTAQSGLILRAQPTQQSNQLALIPNGDKVTILFDAGPGDNVYGIANNWLRVDYGGQRGWVFGGFVERKPGLFADLSNPFNPRLTKAEYEQRVSMVLQKLFTMPSPKSEEIGRARSWAEATSSLKLAAEALARSSAELDAINPPSDIEGTHRKLVAGMREWGAMCTQMAAAIEKGDLDTVQKLKDGPNALRGFDHAAQELGQRGYTLSVEPLADGTILRNKGLRF